MMVLQWDPPWNIYRWVGKNTTSKINWMHDSMGMDDIIATIKLK